MSPVKKGALRRIILPLGSRAPRLLDRAVSPATRRRREDYYRGSSFALRVQCGRDARDPKAAAPVIPDLARAIAEAERSRRSPYQYSQLTKRL